MIKQKKLVCIVPVYNEQDTINKTIESLKNIKVVDELVVVDDGSTDETKEILKEIEAIRILGYEKNRGKGYAIKYALKNINYDYVLLIDGDLEETSNQAVKLINPVLNGYADVTIAKFPEAEKMTNKKGGFGLVKGLAKRGVKYFTGKSIDTTLSGQRVYKKEVLDQINYIPDRYGVEIAMTIQSLNGNFKMLEIPVTMSHRYTERSFKGFIHRGRQFKDIISTLVIMKIKGYKR